jgi:transcriptional regulator with XRE-family HTH domain
MKLMDVDERANRGAAIRRRRVALRLSAADLADAIGYTGAAIYNLEGGRGGGLRLIEAAEWKLITLEEAAARANP